MQVLVRCALLLARALEFRFGFGLGGERHGDGWVYILQDSGSGLRKCPRQNLNTQGKLRIQFRLLWYLHSSLHVNSSSPNPRPRPHPLTRPPYIQVGRLKLLKGSQETLGL